MSSLKLRSFPGGTSGKEPACQCRGRTSHGFNPWVRTISWRRAWQPTPVFLPRESHGQRSPVGYGPWCHRELGMTEATEQAHMHSWSWESLSDNSEVSQLTREEAETGTQICLSKLCCSHSGAHTRHSGFRLLYLIIRATFAWIW